MGVGKLTFHHQALKQHRAIDIAITPEENVSSVLFLGFVLNVTEGIELLWKNTWNPIRRNTQKKILFKEGRILK